MSRTPSSFRCLVGFMLLACFLGGLSPRVLGQAAVPGSPDLSPEQRTKLLDAAQDPRLEPWQRDYMRDLAAPGEQGPADTPEVDGGWYDFGARPRSGHTAIYDPVRDRMIVFGGGDGSSLRNDVWALSLADPPSWNEIFSSGTPPSARQWHTAIYDPVRDRMVVFGGNDGSCRKDTWALSFAGEPTWSQLLPSGTIPAARESHTAVYDPLVDQMVVFGGWSGSWPPRNDTWALSFAGTPTWTEWIPWGTPPAGRSGHTAVYDPVRGRMVVFGGSDGLSYLNDAWMLSLDFRLIWSQLAPSGTPPSGRYGHTAIYDPERLRMVVFGGWDGSRRHDTWSLALAGTLAWSEWTPSETLPPGRNNHTAIYDPVGDRMVVFGGTGGPVLRDTWGLSLAETPIWSELTPPDTPPPARAGHTAICDPPRDRMVIFGGSGGSALDDTWALSLAGTSTWSELPVAGTLPPTRTGHSAIYDPVRERMVIFGGSGGSALNDTWALSLAGMPGWSQLLPSGTPPAPRYGHTAIYDRVRDRMLVFGGEDDALYLYDDTWALSLAGTPTWTELATSGSRPPERRSHSAIYDPVRDRMLIFGGNGGSAGGSLSDVWVLSLAATPAWSGGGPYEGWPSAREGHTAIYDPVGDRMVIFGGYEEGYPWSHPLHDTWALPMTGAWSELSPSGDWPLEREGHTATYDAVRHRMVVFGGYRRDIPEVLDDTWELRWALHTAVAEPGIPLPERPALHPAFPNPASGPTLIRFELPAAGPMRLAIYNVAGRLVRRLAEGSLPAGTQQAEWDGRDEGGRGVAPGVYYARLEAGGRRLTEKVVVLR